MTVIQFQIAGRPRFTFCPYGLGSLNVFVLGLTVEGSEKIAVHSSWW